MTELADAHAAGASVYRSGVAAGLAGVPVATLRIWERRYSVLGPRLSVGCQRLYSAAEIRRLALIKQLVDMGHPISAVAALGYDALSRKRAASRTLERPGFDWFAPAGGREWRVALAGPMLAAAQAARSLSGGLLRIVVACPDSDGAASALAGADADIVLIEFPALRDADLERVQAIKAACGARKAVVLYRFGRSAAIRHLRNAGHGVARATVDREELEAICLSQFHGAGRDPSGTAPAAETTEPRPPRFDERALAELSSASRAIECECPGHLVELVRSLTSFERYSGECANSTPADAALYLELERAAGLARTIVEQALEHVAVAEGFAFPATRASPCSRNPKGRILSYEEIFERRFGGACTPRRLT